MSIIKMQKIHVLSLDSFGDDFNAKYQHIKEFMDPPTYDTIGQIIDELTTTLGLIECGDIQAEHKDKYLNLHLPQIMKYTTINYHHVYRKLNAFLCHWLSCRLGHFSEHYPGDSLMFRHMFAARKKYYDLLYYSDYMSTIAFELRDDIEKNEVFGSKSSSKSENELWRWEHIPKNTTLSVPFYVNMYYFARIGGFETLKAAIEPGVKLKDVAFVSGMLKGVSRMVPYMKFEQWNLSVFPIAKLAVSAAGTLIGETTDVAVLTRTDMAKFLKHLKALSYQSAAKTNCAEFDQEVTRLRLSLATKLLENKAVLGCVSEVSNVVAELVRQSAMAIVGKETTGIGMVVDWFKGGKIFEQILLVNKPNKEILQKCAEADLLGTLYQWNGLAAADVLSLWDSFQQSGHDSELQTKYAGILTKLVGRLKKPDLAVLFGKVTALPLPEITEPVVNLIAALGVPGAVQFLFSLTHDRALTLGLSSPTQQLVIEKFLCLAGDGADSAEYLPTCEKMLMDDNSPFQISQIWLRLIQKSKAKEGGGELVQRLVMNLLRFKLTAIQKAKDVVIKNGGGLIGTSLYDTLVTSPAQKLTYYAEVEQRFRMLGSTIAVTNADSLHADTFSRILTRAFVHNNISQREVDIFLGFMQGISSTASNTAAKSLLVAGAFDALMNDVLLRIDPEAYSVATFGCFRGLFLLFNGHYKHLLLGADQGVAEVLNMQLIGLTFLWDLAFAQHNTQVQPLAADLLFDLYTKISLKLVEKEGGKIRGSFVSECMKRMDSSAVRALEILARYVSVFNEDINNPTPAIKSEFSSTVTVNVTYQDKTQLDKIHSWLRLDSSCTVDYMLHDIVRKGFIRLDVPELVFMCNGEVLRPSGVLISQLGWGREFEVLVEPLMKSPKTGARTDDCESLSSLREMFQGKKEQVYVLALLQAHGDLSQTVTLLSDDSVLAGIEKKAGLIVGTRLAQAYETGAGRLGASISRNEGYFAALYQALSSPEMQVADKAWELLNRLPMPEKIVSEFGTGTDWPRIFQNKSQYTLAYSLKVMRKFLETNFPPLVNDYQKFPPYNKKAKTATAVEGLKWLDRFVRTGGYEYLWKLIGEFPTKDELARPKSPRYVETALFCISELMLFAKEVGTQLFKDFATEGNLSRYLRAAERAEENPLDDIVEAKIQKPGLRSLRIYLESEGAKLGTPLLEAIDRQGVVTLLLRLIREFGDETRIEKMGLEFLEPALLFLGAILAVDRKRYKSLYEDKEFSMFWNRTLLHSSNVELKKLISRMVRAMIEGSKSYSYMSLEEDSTLPPADTFFLNTMIAFLPTGTEPCPHCEHYFSLLIILIGEVYYESDLGGKKQEIAKQLTERILVRLEKDGSDDIFLAGCLECLAKLTKKSPSLLSELGASREKSSLLVLLCDELYCCRTIRKCAFSPSVMKGITSFLLCLTQTLPEARILVLKRMADFHSEQAIIPSKDPVYEFGGKRTEQGKYVGLKNFGSTCYINALLQQFFMMPDLRAVILGLPTESLPEKDCDRVLFNLQKTFSYLLQSDRQYFAPTDFCKDLTWNDHKPVNMAEQHDADEFFNIITDKLEKELKIVEKDKALREMLEVNLIHEIESLEDRMEYVSTKEESCLTLTLEIKNKTHLEDAFDELVKGDRMDGDNKYFCAKYNTKIQAQKRCVFKSVSKTFIIHLKRFEFDKATGIRKKLNDYCSFPVHLNLSKWTREKPDVVQPPLDYELVGVLIHSGTAEAGHYVSIIKERSEEGGNKWLEFNDQKVSPFDFSELQRRCFGKGKSQENVVPSDEWETQGNAYLLVYQRCTLDDKKPGGAERTVVPEKYKSSIEAENTVYARARTYCDSVYENFVKEFQQQWRSSVSKKPLPLQEIEEYEGKLRELCEKTPAAGLRRLIAEYMFDYMTKAKEGKRFRDLAKTIQEEMAERPGFSVWFLKFMIAHKAFMFEGLISSRFEEVRPEVFKLLSTATTNAKNEDVVKELFTLLVNEGFAHARANSNKFDLYFALLQRFAGRGQIELQHLLSLKLVGRLIDFMSNTTTSLMEKAGERPKMSEAYTNFQTPLELLSTLIKSVPTKEMLASKSAPDPVLLLSSSVLLPEELALLFLPEWDCMSLAFHNPKAFQLIVLHLSWESLDRTRNIVKLAFRSMNYYRSTRKYTNALEVLKLLLCAIKDGHLKERFSIVFLETQVSGYKNVVEYIVHLRDCCEELTIDVLNLLAELSGMDVEVGNSIKERILPLLRWVPYYLETGGGNRAIQFAFYAASIEQMKAKREAILSRFGGAIKELMQEADRAKLAAKESKKEPAINNQSHAAKPDSSNAKIKGGEREEAGEFEAINSSDDDENQNRSHTKGKIAIETCNALGDTVSAAGLHHEQVDKILEKPKADKGEAEPLLGAKEPVPYGTREGEVNLDYLEVESWGPEEYVADGNPAQPENEKNSDKLKVTAVEIDTEKRQKAWTEEKKPSIPQNQKRLIVKLPLKEAGPRIGKAEENGMMGLADIPWLRKK